MIVPGPQGFMYLNDPSKVKRTIRPGQGSVNLQKRGIRAGNSLTPSKYCHQSQDELRLRKTGRAKDNRADQGPVTADRCGLAYAGLPATESTTAAICRFLV